VEIFRGVRAPRPSACCGHDVRPHRTESQTIDKEAMQLAPTDLVVMNGILANKEAHVLRTRATANRGTG
jgi:hypothetical protein